MDEQFVIKKIQALLHDPPEKPIILGRIVHEGRAKEIMGNIIKEAEIPDDVKDADHIASAADRINLPKKEEFTADFLKSPIIIHPLSGKKFDLKSLAQLELDKVTELVNDSVSALADKYGKNQMMIYLSLWRELLDLLKAKEENKTYLGQLWELLPADTRIPDHSIWEHKRITSAVAGALPNPAFLLFAIGPVQDFIATARKTQDLWSGSYMLSYLSWCAMKTISETYGPDCIIFPDLCRQPMADLWLIEKGLKIEKPNKEKLSSPTLPNRFLAIIPEESVTQVANLAKQAVKDTFVEICRSVKDKIAEKLQIKAHEWNDLWERQSKDFLEIYWACTNIENAKKTDSFLEFYKNCFAISKNWKFEELYKEYQQKGFKPNIGTLYGQIYRLTEKMLGSRKTVRDFVQVEEPNHKCTLCGVREPIHPGKHNDKDCSEDFGALRSFWQDKMLKEYPDIRRSERLCAICTTKRLASKLYFRDIKKYEIDGNFPSVSMIATAPFKLRIIENMNTPELHVAVTNFVNIIKKLAGERWNGVAVPMVRRACKDSDSYDFAILEGDWLYKETLENIKALRDEGNSQFTEEQFNELCNSAKSAQKRLFATVSSFEKETNKKIGIPSIYYAVLLMDGDNMGKWLSGEKAPTIADILHPEVANTLDVSWKALKEMERPLNPSLHLSISKALRDFSLHIVREVVEKDHLGKLVYAGGDDVLAFVSLSDLLDVMRKLRAYFSGSVNIDLETNRINIDFNNGSGYVPLDEEGIPINVGSGKPVKGFLLTMGSTATASMGVVIAHHSSNLSQILDEVRRCEKKAKEIKDKDAFRIALVKRAGGTEYFSSKWYVGANRMETIPVLQEWADAFYHDYLSPKMVYAFRAESVGLANLPREAVATELFRIADRQRNKKKSDFDKDKLKRMVNRLMELLSDESEDITEHKIEYLSVFLSIAAFLGREGNR